MQNTFLALVEKRRFSSEDHIRYWLIRVSINKCKIFLKSSARKVLRLEDVNPAFTPKEIETFEELDRLPDMDRNILYLHYYEGYSVKEIGKILKISQNAVYVRMTRSRKKLKRLLEENGEE